MNSGQILSSLVHSSMKVHGSYKLLKSTGIGLFTTTVFLAFILVNHVQHTLLRGLCTQRVWYSACTDT